jgi:oxygen-independent coproporphyrinogen-3 oxidase
MKEITNYAERPQVRNSEVISGYIGGGTPTSLSTEQLDALLTHIEKSFNLMRDNKFFNLTIETTPNEMTREKALMLRSHGINRISVGGQAFDDQLLRNIGRTHTAEKIREVVSLLREVGFEHVCVDIMYGLPGQTIDLWEKTLNEFLKIKADSLGFYPYLVIPNSKLYDRIKRGIMPETPNQDLLDQMFDIGVETLLSAGYFCVTPNELGKETYGDGGEKWKGYDVKAFDIGTKGYKGIIASTFPVTTHIAHSWYEGGDYLGIGAGAYGYFNDYWYLNEPDVEKYIAMIKKNKLPIVGGSYMNMEEKVARFLVMGTKFIKLLRSDFTKRFGVDMTKVFPDQIKQLTEWGLIEMQDDSLEVTYPKGWYYIDNISKKFYTPENYKLPQTTLTNTNVLRYMEKQ